MSQQVTRQSYVRFLIHYYCRYGDVYFTPEQVKMAVDGIQIDPVYKGVSGPEVARAVREEEGGQGGDGGGQREEGGGQASQEVTASEDSVFRRRLVNVVQCTYLIPLKLFTLGTLHSITFLTMEY